MPCLLRIREKTFVLIDRRGALEHNQYRVMQYITLVNVQILQDGTDIDGESRG